MLAALFAALVTAIAAPAADAHRLSISRAHYAVEGVAEYVFDDPEIQALVPAPVDYGAGGCERHGAHAVSCAWAILFEDDSYCGQIVLVRFKNARSRAVRLYAAS